MTTNIQSITPAWLTNVLHTHNALPQGQVVAIEQKGNDAFNSAIVHLAVSYSGDAPETAPRRLFLKRNIEAQFHAFWWQHPLLNKDVSNMLQYYSDFAQTQQFWNSFIASEGSWFPANLRALYEEALSNLPQLWERFLASRIPTLRNMTMSHSDCYLSQFLCPNDHTSGPTYLVDFQGASTDFATFDLVHLFAAFWTREQRKENNREVAMLRRYHEGLQSHGVTGYSWDNLLTDYRVLLTYMLFYPVWDQTNGSGKDYWWPKMRCLVDAYQDWECAALVQT